MNYKALIHYLGLNSLIVSFFSILNILYSVYFDFTIDLNSYLITFLISIFFGLTFFHLGKNFRRDVSLTDQIIFILLSFVLIPFLISLH
jgi:trk system potassium uptake protein TrkH